MQHEVFCSTTKHAAEQRSAYSNDPQHQHRFSSNSRCCNTTLHDTLNNAFLHSPQTSTRRKFLASSAFVCLQRSSPTCAYLTARRNQSTDVRANGRFYRSINDDIGEWRCQQNGRTDGRRASVLSWHRYHHRKRHRTITAARQLPFSCRWHLGRRQMHRSRGAWQQAASGRCGLRPTSIAIIIVIALADDAGAIISPSAMAAAVKNWRTRRHRYKSFDTYVRIRETAAAQH